MPKKAVPKDDIIVEENETTLHPLVMLAADIVKAYVSRNQVPMAELPDFVVSVFKGVAGVDGHAGPLSSITLKPAVSVKKSIGDDYLICLEDGKKLTMLKRYLMAQFGMTPEQYRKKWDLPHDYPMVAPSYARLRSAFAKKIGLGRTGDNPRRGRRPKTP